MSKKIKYVVLGTNGIPCPRCSRPTEIRGHTAITAKHRSQPYYYSRWFNCSAVQCQTTLIMRDEYKVFNKSDGKAPAATQEPSVLMAERNRPAVPLYSGESTPWE